MFCNLQIKKKTHICIFMQYIGKGMHLRAIFTWVQILTLLLCSRSLSIINSGQRFENWMIEITCKMSDRLSYKINNYSFFTPSPLSITLLGSWFSDFRQTLRLDSWLFFQKVVYSWQNGHLGCETVIKFEKMNVYYFSTLRNTWASQI